MAHKLDPHYSDFAGLDTASNVLTQNPKSARIGSKNWRYNYADQLQKREGFQHKAVSGAGCEAGLIEYKYKDINTGESLTQILGVSWDGYLRKRYAHRLKFVLTSGTNVYSYDFYYDSNTALYTMVFKGSSGNTLATITFGTAADLDTVKGSINGSGLTNFTASTVDEDGTVVTSSLKAYLLDHVKDFEFNTSGDTVYNDVYDWTTVTTPDSAAPFAVADANETNDDYEGISYVNLNNCCYITDGGFVYKYDGYSVYRAGMPRNIGGVLSGCTVAYDAATAGPSVSTTGARYLSYQYAFRDPSGSTIYGKINGTNIYEDSFGVFSYEELSVDILDAAKSAKFSIKRIAQTTNFPIYACAPSSTQTFSGTGSKTVNVKANHNILAGMYLRLATRTVNITDFVYYAKVTSVAATSITFTCPVSLPGIFNTTGLLQDVVLNGFYGPDILAGTSQNTNYLYNPATDINVWGPYILFSSTKAGASAPPDAGVRYIYSIAGIPHRSDHEYDIRTSINDTYLVDSGITEGEQLPRACKYLSSWQGQLIQAGRPVPTNLTSSYYPSLYTTPPTAVSLWAKYNLYYSEADLCDYQSIYWADVDYPEGFPQSGLTEQIVESPFNDQITGIISNKDALFAFKDRTTAYLTGTLATGDLVFERLEADIGAATQSAIQEVRGAIMFMDSNLGFWTVVAGRLPVYVGNPIQDYFKENAVATPSTRLFFKRAKSANFRAYDQYICFIPANYASVKDSSSNSIAFVYDYAAVKTETRNQWYAWQGINAGGGILATADDELLLAQDQTTKCLWKQKFLAQKYNYSDHQTAIEFNYKGAFLTYGKPTIDKNFIKCIINSTTGDFTLRVDQYANFIDTVIGDTSFTFSAASSSSIGVKQAIHANPVKVESMSFGFYNNTIHDDVKINGWDIEVSLSFDPGEEKK